MFKQIGRSEPLLLVESFSNSEGRLHTRDLVSDRPGRSFSGASSGVRHSHSSGEEKHDVLSTKFAGTLATYIDHARKQDLYDKLVVVAEPRFLGKIKSALSDEVTKKLALVIHKDLMKVPNHELMEHLEELGGVA